MAHGLNSSKSAARPAYQAIEKASDNAIGSFKTEHRRLANLAMRWARRAQNRLLANEHQNPGNTVFSK
jgi:hypothetical protein